MQHKSIYIYTAMVASIAGIISLVFMLKEMRNPIVVTDYMRVNDPGPSLQYSHSDSNKPEVNISYVKGETTTTSSPEPEHKLSFNYDSPQDGPQKGIKIYKFKNKPEAPKDPKKGDIVTIPVPYSQDGQTAELTYTCELDYVENNTQDNKKITSLHGKLTGRTTKEGGKQPDGDATIIIIDEHLSVTVHDKANERFYYIFYTKNKENGEIEYTCEETDMAECPVTPKENDIFY